jgi:dihydrofolate reductase
MSAAVLDMSMSLDGYVADLDDYLGGADGERLHHWAAATGVPGPVKDFEDEWNAAGAVLAGRRTAELMDHWGGRTTGGRSSCPAAAHRARPPDGATRW